MTVGPGRTTITALGMAMLVAITGCSRVDSAGDPAATNTPAGVGSTTAVPAGGSTSPEPTSASPSTSSASATSTSQTSTAPASPASSSGAQGSGDYQAGFGLTFKLLPGWQLVKKETDDANEQVHRFTNRATGGRLVVQTEKGDDDTPAQMCAAVQADLRELYAPHGEVTQTRGSSDSPNSASCGLSAKDPSGTPIEVTIFAARGSTTSFVTTSTFAAQRPAGVSQDDFSRAIREASMMGSDLLDDLV